MFRKLVSNLAFSPALVGQLGFYAKRLKKEEATRRLGLIFTALALVIQSFAVFSPPEAANASNPSNFINGGVTSLNDYLSHYDANTNNIKDLFSTLGITRGNVASAHTGQINSKSVYSWGLTSRFSEAQGERTYTIRTSNGGTRTFFYRPLSLSDTGSNTRTGSYYDAYIGTSSTGMWFALIKVCGNLILKVIPPAPKCPTGTVGTYPNCTVPPRMCTIPGKTHLPASDPDCRVTPKCTIPGKTDLPANDPRCKPDPVATCTSLRITKLINNYQFDGASSAEHGATIKSYTYTIKRDGQVIETKTINSTELSNTYNYSQTRQGSYTVELTIKTSIGTVGGADCIKTFNIAPPEMCPQHPSIPKSSPDCQPCPGDPTLWIKDKKCRASIIKTKTARNTSQNKNAVDTVAKPSDRIVYSLNVENIGLAPATISIKEELDDVIEYASIIDNGSGTLTNKVMTWPSITLQPGEKQTRMFTVQVLSTIPAMGQGVSDKTSYDCKMINTFGNAVEINVDCPIQKQVIEQTTSELPHTGPRENMIFAGVVLSVVAYFYARTRQVKKEVRLIRRDFNSGTI